MKRIILTAFLLMAGIALYAKVELPAICGDGMVLQQNTQAVVWGTASPYSQITVTPSWDKESYMGKADVDGRWEVKVSTPAASYMSHTLTVKGDGSVIEINDVLVGEVWFASGQSNMQMPMEGYFNHPEVSEPCQVRYGWGDFNPGNLANTAGLPVAPFWVKLEK